jgi:hypothetical protein
VTLLQRFVNQVPENVADLLPDQPKQVLRTYDIKETILKESLAILKGWHRRIKRYQSGFIRPVTGALPGAWEMAQSHLHSYAYRRIYA